MARRPAECFPPADFVRDELAERDITIADFEAQMGYSPETMAAFWAGKLVLTGEFALALALTLPGPSPEFWLRLDAAWQHWRRMEVLDG